VESSPADIDIQPPTKSAWETTPAQREASLAERKAQMILAARQRLLEKQAKAAVSPS